MTTSTPANEPFFSVIIPTYNRALKCVRAVESVLAQTFNDYDIWVIDDGSTDPTALSLQPYMDKIHYIRQKNSGVAEARNTGIRSSKGRNLAFLDSDDVWYPNKLEAIADEIRNHSEAGLFYSGAHFCDEQGNILWEVKARYPKNYYLALLKADFIVASSIVVTRQCLDQIGLFDGRVNSCEDWDLLIRIARRYPIQPSSKILVKYERSGSEKITSQHLNWIAIQQKVLEYAFQNDPELSPNIIKSSLASLAYVRGRIFLDHDEPEEALRSFNYAFTQDPSNWKAGLYLLILRSPWLRRHIPQQFKVALRLPEAFPPGSK